jgi:hypothetical protein
MNRLLTLILIGLAGLFMASCGSSVSSTTQPAVHDTYSMAMTPVLFSLNSGDWTSISATVDLSYDGGTPKAVSPQPTIKFSSSDQRVSVSPAGLVCAGQWDTRYLTCTPTATIPTGYVTISAYAASRNVVGTTMLSIHSRAASITLNGLAASTNPAWPGSTQPWPSNPKTPSQLATCVSQNNQVKYVAQPMDANGNPIQNCSILPEAPGCIHDNDYAWTVDNTSVATVSNYGFVAALNPGVTNVFAKLNGTVSAPLAFATCPPSSIVLTTSPYTQGTPTPPYNTGDLDTLGIGSALYANATLLDTNGNPLITSPLNYITSDPLTLTFTPDLALTSKLTANTAGGFTMMASCVPPSCNPSVQNFVSPAGVETSTGTGFGFPVYSNVVGGKVLGQTASSVLVTGTRFANSPTAPTPDCPANQSCPHQLQVFDSESLSLTHTIELANLPNSLVVAPNGATAYLGSSGGLVVVGLTSFQSATMVYPIVGGLNTDVVTGTVLGVSPDSRYVLLSDVTNGLVFLIDTTGTKSAIRYTIPNITAVAFAADDSEFWIGGSSGVYVYQADTFVPISSQTPADAGISTNVNSIAWMPDGQSYFVSGSSLTDYSTCNGQNPQTPTPNLTSSIIGGLSATKVQEVTDLLTSVPHLLGLDGTQWFDYTVSNSAQVANQTVTSLSNLAATGTGNVCKSTVTIATPPVSVASTLLCTPQQVTFSPTLEQEFITGVDPSCPATNAESLIHGYDVVKQKEITLTTTAPVIPLSGGVLHDGRKLYFGTWDSTAQTASLHRIDLSTSTGTQGTLTEDVATGIPASVSLVPSFVAVVPK